MNVLEDLLAALPLRGEARDGPHLDLYAGVKLLPPHVPHAVTRRGHGPVLRKNAQVHLLHAGVYTHTHTNELHHQNGLLYNLQIRQKASIH